MIQRQIFASSEKELTKAEYNRLLLAASSKKNERLYLLMQTICSIFFSYNAVLCWSALLLDRYSCGYLTIFFAFPTN